MEKGTEMPVTRSTVQKMLDTVSSATPAVILVVLAGLIPVFFLPFTPDFFDFNKTFLVALAAGLAVIAWAVRTIVNRSLRISLSPVLLPILGFGIVLLLSTFFSSGYPDEVFTGRGLLVLALTLLFVAITSAGKSMKSEYVIYSITVGALVMSLNTILEMFGVGFSRVLNMTLGLQLPDEGLFHFGGAVLIGATVLAPLTIVHALEAFAAKNPRQQAISGVAAGLCVMAFVVHVWLMLPGKAASPLFLPFNHSLSIALDTLKDSRTALLGVGPESYLTAFSLHRPIELNIDPNWNLRYGSATVEPLQILTTLGLLGLGAWLALVGLSAKMVFPLKDDYRPLAVFTLGLLIESFFVPLNTVTLSLLYIALTAVVLALKKYDRASLSDMILHLFAIKIVAPESQQRIEKHVPTQALAISISVLSIAGVLVSGFFLTRVYANEHLFYQSLVAAQRNDGLTTYNTQSQLIANAPRVDRYRRSFAATNFLIASNIAQNENATPEERAQVPQLIQQAIREAKAAAELDPRKAVNWESLASIYRELIGIAESADQWTIAAYVRVIQSDPTNPVVRLELGRIYVTIQNYDQAIRLFQQAVELKPDWANAYYNLANAYAQRGDSALALQALQQTLSLLPADSTDRPTVEQQIAELTKTVEAAQKGQQTQQAQTQQQSDPGTAVPDGQIRLPEDLGLPEATPPPIEPEQ